MLCTENANMSNEEKRKRSKNFSEKEELVLTVLVEERKSILDNKKSDADTWRRKKQAWKELADRFYDKTGVRRECKALREKLVSIRRRTRLNQSGTKSTSYFSSGHPSPRTDTSLINDSFTGLSNAFDSDGCK